VWNEGREEEKEWVMEEDRLPRGWGVWTFSLSSLILKQEYLQSLSNK
jgi:hypothetical protein